jgi:hypothetical protein
MGEIGQRLEGKISHSFVPVERCVYEVAKKLNKYLYIRILGNAGKASSVLAGYEVTSQTKFNA